MEFQQINKININEIESWQNKIFLTFDVDWVVDEVLSYTIDIVEEYGINATFFLTHETKLIDRMKKNPNIELGIHPNFNFLLDGDFRYGKNIDQVLKYYINIYPEAISVRSHSVTQSSLIDQLFVENNLLFDVNTFIPFSNTMLVKPWYKLNHLSKIPYFWEDDIQISNNNDEWETAKYFNFKGIKVFNFHPIHIFLNCEKIERYYNCKHHFTNYNKLTDNRNTNKYGAKDYLLDIIKMHTP